MESQNHYYGHSGALARYVGLDRPRHIRGLVQHGWTTVSPTQTHFRDFPTIGAPGGRTDRSLFVWSHTSRAWDHLTDARATVPIGAPWAYLCASSDRSGTRPGERSGTVILPVHGIPTQRMHGDHVAAARRWFDSEGPATVCLYHVEAGDPRIVDAYRTAGHRCVTLGKRTDGAFLGRLHVLLSTAARVVSNRLSSPVLYAAAIGVDVAVYGDAMHLDGEPAGETERVAELWPEFSDPTATPADRRTLGRSEIGADALRDPDELRSLLGWDRALRGGPWMDHWVVAPGSRAVTNIRRRGSQTPDRASVGTSKPAVAMSASAWVRGAISYLPHPLGLVVEPTSVAPFALNG